MPSFDNHIFSSLDIARPMLEQLIARADELRNSSQYPQILQNKIVGLFFFEPSTRTYLGFDSATKRLGGSTVELSAAKLTDSMLYSESLSDTFKSVSSYCDLIVLRHPSIEEFQQALNVSEVPIINGGAGWCHHPTQACIDIFAIWNHFHRIDGLKVGIVGNLAQSRSASSLCELLSYYELEELRLMAPSEMSLSPNSLTKFSKNIITEFNYLEVDKLDVLYVAGLPGIRGQVRNSSIRRPFQVTMEKLSCFHSEAIILSPLPVVDEIDAEVDMLSASHYFLQSKHAQFMRMAILELVTIG